MERGGKRGRQFCGMGAGILGQVSGGKGDRRMIYIGIDPGKDGAMAVITKAALRKREEADNAKD